MVLGIENDESGESNIHVVDSRAYSVDEIATETVVVDSVGQKLTLRIENTRGGGGQRRVVLFCPIWIVNTTDHALRYKQEKAQAFVAGTVVSPAQNGSQQIDGRMRRPAQIFHRRKAMRSPNRNLLTEVGPARRNRDKVFPGTPGALAGTTFLMSRERLASLLEKDLPVETLASIACMFNFSESIAQQRLCVQLADGTGRSKYLSDWSHGFSLDSVGVPQLVG